MKIEPKPTSLREFFVGHPERVVKNPYNFAENEANEGLIGHDGACRWCILGAMDYMGIVISHAKPLFDAVHAESRQYSATSFLVDNGYDGLVKLVEKYNL